MPLPYIAGDIAYEPAMSLLSGDMGVREHLINCWKCCFTMLPYIQRLPVFDLNFRYLVAVDNVAVPSTEHMTIVVLNVSPAFLRHWSLLTRVLSCHSEHNTELLALWINAKRQRYFVSQNSGRHKHKMKRRNRRWRRIKKWKIPFELRKAHLTLCWEMRGFVFFCFAVRSLTLTCTQFYCIDCFCYPLTAETCETEIEFKLEKIAKNKMCRHNTQFAQALIGEPKKKIR